MNDLPQRKRLRLRRYDYSRPGYYFVTVCTKLRGENVLCTAGAAALGGPSAVDAGISEGPRVTLTAIGEAVAQSIENINRVYAGRASVGCSVIMPDHIHLIIRIHDTEILTEEAARMLHGGAAGKTRNWGDGRPEEERDLGEGPPRAAAPTVALPKIINALKGLTSKKAGSPLWQRGYYEHIIRNDEDLQNTRQYIRDNPLKWLLNPCQDDPAP